MKKRKKHLIAIGLLALAGLPAFGQKPTKPETAGEPWEIRWSASDEFNSDSPDWKKWILKGGLPAVSAWKWDNELNVVNHEGIAEIAFRHNAEDQADAGTYFTSGILKSYRTFTYGFYEARIKGAALPGSGVCPSFWLYSNFDDKVAEGETIYCEIDVVELQQFDWLEGHQDDVSDIDLNLHCVVKKDGKRSWRRPKAFPEEQLNKWRAPWDPREEFHIYGCEVSEKEIVWYIDGKEVARKPNLYWHRPMNIALSLGARKPFVRFEGNRNVAVNPIENADAKVLLPELPAAMSVDYVRVWEKN